MLAKDFYAYFKDCFILDNSLFQVENLLSNLGLSVKVENAEFLRHTRFLSVGYRSPASTNGTGKNNTKLAPPRI